MFKLPDFPKLALFRWLRLSLVFPDRAVAVRVGHSAEQANWRGLAGV